MDNLILDLEYFSFFQDLTVIGRLEIIAYLKMFNVFKDSF